MAASLPFGSISIAAMPFRLLSGASEQSKEIIESERWDCASPTRILSQRRLFRPDAASRFCYSLVLDLPLRRPLPLPRPWLFDAPYVRRLVLGGTYCA
jgi:hypothetical protein